MVVVIFCTAWRHLFQHVEIVSICRLALLPDASITLAPRTPERMGWGGLGVPLRHVFQGFVTRARWNFEVLCLRPLRATPARSSASLTPRCSESPDTCCWPSLPWICRHTPPPCDRCHDFRTACVCACFVALPKERFYAPVCCLFGLLFRPLSPQPCLLVCMYDTPTVAAWKSWSRFWKDAKSKRAGYARSPSLPPPPPSLPSRLSKLRFVYIND